MSIVYILSSLRKYFLAGILKQRILKDISSMFFFDDDYRNINAVNFHLMRFNLTKEKLGFSFPVYF
jgi:hypothetical protein